MNFLFFVFDVISILIAAIGSFSMAGFTSYFLSSYMIGLEIFAVKYYVYQLKPVFGMGIVIMALFDGLSAY